MISAGQEGARLADQSWNGKRGRPPAATLAARFSRSICHPGSGGGQTATYGHRSGQNAAATLGSLPPAFVFLGAGCPALRRDGQEFMLEAAGLALRDILAPPFRSVLWKSLVLTIGLLAALWIVLEGILAYFVALPYGWLDTAFSILTGIGLVIGLGFLVAPVTAGFAGLFLDDIAEVVERTHYPAEPPGRAVPFARSLMLSVKFLGAVLAVNAIALPLVLFVGFGFVVFLVANAYLLSREYFQLAALRFHGEETAARLRARHSGRIFAAGLLIAGLLALPIVNLVGPLFATAFMVHLQKRLASMERRPGGLLAG
jgi:CysZ protein